jgi:hypothetical protein
VLKSVSIGGYVGAADGPDMLCYTLYATLRGPRQSHRGHGLRWHPRSCRGERSDRLVSEALWYGGNGQ